MSGKPLSLYIHIPFCTKKCPYCHFYVIPDREEHKDLLLDSLLLEWETIQRKIEGNEIVSVYFGGGTPSLFGPERIEMLLRTIKPPPCEVTLEANPENVTLSLMKSYKEAGINRVSLGVQSLVDDSLVTLGRSHNATKAMTATEEVYDAGIDNISIDLMMELPSQTSHSFEKTLQLLPSLPITHLSLYNLTIEPHTSFYKNRNKLTLPSEEEGLAMLKCACSKLESIGLKRYEISAFAKPGYESVHNTGYWKGRTFYGLGPSAFSYAKGRRFRNVANLNRYAKALASGESSIDFEESLSSPANVHELLCVKLRMIEGAHLPNFNLPSATHKTLQDLSAKGYLFLSKERAKLTEKGLLFYNEVASTII